jgi:hypothetical protein
MFKDGTVRATAVVAARVVITVPNLIALRDLLNRVISAPQQPAPPAVDQLFTNVPRGLS